MRSRVARLALCRVLERIRAGRIDIVEAGRRRSFGPSDAELAVEVRVRDPRAWEATLHGSASWGGGYVDGLWDTEDPVTLTRIAARELPRLDAWRRPFQPVIGRLQRLAALVPRNTPEGAKRNIAAHYDLGNDLFAAFLDERMIYSCAYFETPGATLEDAQVAKLDRVCERLRLGPDDHLVEIGTGWGGLAVHAAADRGCRVTTTTISREQRALAVERVRDAQLEGHVDVLERDYRDLRGSYSRLASVEMIEAVGWQYFDAFFIKVAELLRDDGLAFLQAIVVDDRAYELEKGSKTFANTYIFPGGCLPSMAVIAEKVARNTDMSSIWQEDISAHYVRTLQIWRERFEARWQELREKGYDERFRRLWRFYLSFCEAGFAERRIRDVQILLAKPGWRGDTIRRSSEASRTAAHALTT
jgi:cyclopropane-fatty-acyl-phospholipid synthase